ncbi:TadA family conjugal transfer-associated ATPase [Micropruina sp.]|uniref:TadA family conjugal transfer-associated ATPase n=1 Tax=Micropruina sp. TaxID=2737536 RepID=UPI0039E6BB39
MTDTRLDDVRSVLGRTGAELTPGSVADALRGLGLLVSEGTVRETVEELRRESAGAGPLQPLLALRGVTDVLVNGHRHVYVDRGAGLECVESPFDCDDDVRRLAVRLAAVVGRRLDEGTPFVDARLPDGTRVHALLGVLTDVGTCLSLRVPARTSLTLADWVGNGTMHQHAAQLLDALVAARAAFLISGGTGSGKTTLLATLLGRVPPTQRIVVVEDSRELAPDHPHVLRLEARPANAEGAGAVDLSTLVRQALRMRPDRLVVGEVRGAELADLLAALNTGHDGGCGTVHANSADDVPARLEALAALGGVPRAALHAQAAAALDVLLHIGRLPDGLRWVQQVYLLQWHESSGLCRPVPAWTFPPGGEPVAHPGAADLAKVLRWAC